MAEEKQIDAAVNDLLGEQENAFGRTHLVFYDLEDMRRYYQQFYTSEDDRASLYVDDMYGIAVYYPPDKVFHWYKYNRIVDRYEWRKSTASLGDVSGKRVM